MKPSSKTVRGLRDGPTLTHRSHGQPPSAPGRSGRRVDRHLSSPRAPARTGEPAAGLSPVNVDNLLRIILGLKDRYGLTVFIVEHILRVVMDTCGIVTVLDHGQKIAEGTPDEVKNDHSVIEAYLGREMGDEEVRAALQA